MELNSEFVSIGVIPVPFVCDRAIGQRLQWPLTTQCLETFFAKPLKTQLNNSCTGCPSLLMAIGRPLAW